MQLANLLKVLLQVYIERLELLLWGIFRGCQGEEDIRARRVKVDRLGEVYCLRSDLVYLNLVLEFLDDLLGAGICYRRLEERL